jgi:hypothetical protein
MDTLALVAPHLSPYLTLTGLVPGGQYTYAKRTGPKLWPAIATVFHTPDRKKLPKGSWLYVATDNPAGPAGGGFQPLYVGSQTMDRMFRGDGMGGLNFHHAQMRNERGRYTLAEHLDAGKRAYVHVISGDELVRLAHTREDWAPWRPLTAQLTKHVGYWFEQAILVETVKGSSSPWAFNCAPADSTAVRLCRASGW